jgi:hypothetical protein
MTISEVLLNNSESTLQMVPNSHIYDGGVVFSANIGSEYSLATLIFSDGDESIQLEIELGSSCIEGDANIDNQINVLDVITTMNIVLTNGSYSCKVIIRIGVKYAKYSIFVNRIRQCRCTV